MSKQHVTTAPAARGECRPLLPEAYKAAALLGSLQPDTLYFPEQAARRIRLAAPDVPDAYQLLQDALAAGWLTAEPTGELSYCGRCLLRSPAPEQYPAPVPSVAYTPRFRPAPARATRRPYTRADYNYLRQHYANSTLAACAAHLGRTVGSLKGFIYQHPELRKHGTP